MMDWLQRAKDGYGMDAGWMGIAARGSIFCVFCNKDHPRGMGLAAG